MCLYASLHVQVFVWTNVCVFCVDACDSVCMCVNVHV